jgi:hypothetical protein
MTTHHTDPDTYRWGLAPAHLKTRRQLRAAGLCPNRKAPVALLVRESRGRRLWAYLFDIRQATPRRPATPAQLEALARATRARQIRAAERRGISSAELLTTTDPGPQWAAA